VPEHFIGLRTLRQAVHHASGHRYFLKAPLASEGDLTRWPARYSSRQEFAGEHDAERAKAIRDDLPQDVYNIAGPVLGPNFTKEKLPLVGQFIDKVVKDAGFGVGPVKQKYMKPRPFKYSEELATAFPDIAKSTVAGPIRRATVQQRSKSR
jgi:hypothetical protein